MLGVAALPVGGQQRLCLDRVAQRRTGAMPLDDVDVGRGQAGIGKRSANHPLL